MIVLRVIYIILYIYIYAMLINFKISKNYLL